MKRALFIFIAILLFGFSANSVFAGGGAETDDSYDIAVFIPGQIEGSPTYEMLADGVDEAVAAAVSAGMDVSVKILEAGYNQAEWEEKLQSLAATGSYNLIVSSNPSIPDLIANINRNFPDQKYLVMDAENPGLENLTAVMLNQYEQAYLSGYFAGLVTISEELSGSNPEKVAGLIVGQEYPVMNNSIRPGFANGFAAAAGTGTSIEFRVLGNWYDAEKAKELADSVIRQGADVILTIAGSGSQGVVTSAENAGVYVLWYDSPGYAYGPGTVIGSSMVLLDSLARELVMAAIEGSAEYGVTVYRGIAENAVDYDRADPGYQNYVPDSIQEAMEILIQGIADGSIVIGH